MAEYIVNDEVLREVLDALDPTPNNPLSTHSLIKAILASPPAEPMAWIKKTDSSDIWQQEPKHPEFFIPLYRKVL
jgi:hypothetical protein